MALVRKNVMVDADQVRALARAFHTSESEAIRIAVDRALHLEEVRSAVTEIRKRGGVEDVFGRTRDDDAGTAPRAAAAS